VKVKAKKPHAAASGRRMEGTFIAAKRALRGRISQAGGIWFARGFRRAPAGCLRQAVSLRSALVSSFWFLVGSRRRFPLSALRIPVSTPRAWIHRFNPQRGARSSIGMA
jgi:hypothetical protein